MLLSIIIPCYNAEKFIGTLLENVCTQVSPYSNEVEILLVNDGSSDRTEEIAGEFSARYSFLHIITQQNRGEGGARNTGIKAAKGEYLSFLDSDDSLSSGAVTQYLKIIQKNLLCDILCFSYQSVTEEGSRTKYQAPRYNQRFFSEKNEFLKAFLSKRLPAHVCSVIVRKDFLLESGILFTERLKIGADIEFLLKVFSKIQTAYYSDYSCFIYQIRNDSVMAGYRSYSDAQYHSFEIRRDILLDKFYQQPDLKRYSNFWIQNQYLSNLRYYRNSGIRDPEIAESLKNDACLLKLSSIRGKGKYKAAVCIAKRLPKKILFTLFRVL